VTGARIHVLCRVNDSVLDFVLKFRVHHRKRESKVDSFLLQFGLLLDIFDQINFLFMVEDANLGVNLRRVAGGGHEFRAPAQGACSTEISRPSCAGLR